VPDPTWSQVVATAFLGSVALWLAHNYRRQIRLRLAERQVESYQALWKITAVATPERTQPLDHEERHKLYDDMVRWYFEQGHGIFASTETRDLFVGIRSNLLCPPGAMKPSALARELDAIDLRTPNVGAAA